MSTRSTKRLRLARLVRTLSTDKVTLGCFTTDKFACKTLELPWLNNVRGKSCIPTGIYQVIWSKSSSHGIYTYEVLKVKDRDGIRIHPANFTSQLRGCIALGMFHSDINHDGVMDITNSKSAVAGLEDALERMPFTLVIENSRTLDISIS